MFLSKLQTAARRRGAACVGAGAAILLAIAALGAAEPPRDKTDLSWIDQRVVDWELSDQERRFDQIGWTSGLDEAERLARQSQRPLFVFTYSGSATEPNAIALRRC